MRSRVRMARPRTGLAGSRSSSSSTSTGLSDARCDAGLEHSAYGRDDDIAILDRAVIALQKERPRRALVAVERAARGPRDVLARDHLVTVEHDRDQPPHQGDLVGVPLPGRLRRRLVRRDEAVDRPQPLARNDAQGGILDLHLVAAPQIDTAVAMLGEAELHVELEVAVAGVRLEVGATAGVRKPTTHHAPVVLPANRVPPRQIAP